MNYLSWVEAIYNWQYHPDANGTFVHCMIYAYRGADYHNKKRLGDAFPELREAMADWDNSLDNGNALFKRLGIGHFKNE